MRRLARLARPMAALPAACCAVPLPRTFCEAKKEQSLDQFLKSDKAQKWIELNSDKSQSCLVNTDTIDWIQTAAGGVRRKMIERLGGEVARATTVVSFEPNASFPSHRHEGGEEFIVLEGDWFDDWATQPSYTYVRNYIGSRHTPRIGPKGCTILVKLCQMSTEQTEPDHSQWDISSSNPSWRRSPNGRRELRVYESPFEEVHFERWEPHQTGQVEVDGAGEEVFVVEGSFVDELGEHRRWSWCRASAAARGGARRLTRRAGPEGCLLYIKSRHLKSPEDCFGLGQHLAPLTCNLLVGRLAPWTFAPSRSSRVQLLLPSSGADGRTGADRLMLAVAANHAQGGKPWTKNLERAGAQSRMKMLTKLQEEAVAVDFDDPYLQLDFPAASALPPPCISVIEAAFGYTSDRILYEGLDFGVDCDSRVAIVGPNGAGKSTFLKLLDGSLEPTKGFVRRHAKLQLARFTQHHIEMMDPDSDAVTHMRKLGSGGIKEDGTSEVTIEEARKYLGRFGLHGDLALQPVKFLSGGQKSRLAFAELAWSSPHIMLLDEPTNHLDLETIEGLAMALNKFEGGVVLVSHDDRLVSMVADELWVVTPGPSKEIPGRVTVFEGSFEEYREMLRSEFIDKNLTSGGRIKRKT
ncbi:unnamed protein product [Effrenium voratum]|nr:unnamed protein product [Effrenium voratum]